MKQNDLDFKSISIQTAYDNYFNLKYNVNRKYQRKLVWTIEEKQGFIDSISKNYPVPLFLLAQIDNSYEIIDGMQRLNSVFSFIEGEFGVEIDGEEKFFDLKVLPTTAKQLSDEELKQKTPLLEYEICRTIANYNLPFSIASFEQEANVEEIFRRINSNGRHLSNQELRQAGALGKFSDLVRKISSQIRRDSTPSDTLSLNKMKQVSLSNRRLPYGVNLFDTFWIDQKIIDFKNMRVSRDEEVVSFILIYMILGRSVEPSNRNLDYIYKFKTENSNPDHLSSVIEDSIERIGVEKIEKQFFLVFNELERILQLCNKKFSDLVYNGNHFAKVRVFQVVFLAIYNQLIEGKKIADDKCLIDKLTGIADRRLTNIKSKDWGGRFRDEIVKSIQGIINECFVQLNQPEDPSFENWIVQLENILRQSRVEQQQYDFKIGLHRLNNSADFAQSSFSKIIKTLTAMANLGPTKVGYVIVGIADNDTDANQHKQLYGVEPINYSGFKIVGVEDEANRSFGNLDDYHARIRDLVRAEPIHNDAKSYILSNLRLVSYYGKQLLVFKIQSSRALYYGKEYFERNASSLQKIEPEELELLFSRFQK